MKPADLTPQEVLLLCWAAGAVLTRDGDGIRVEGPKGRILPELVEAIRANKAALLAMLPGELRLETQKQLTLRS